jgi:predicted DNA-binding transcriptional regulator AlpA
MATETNPPAPQATETLLALDATILLIGAKEVARRLSISGRTWSALVSTHHAPQPIRFGKRTLWRVEELEEWVRDGCPPLDRWQRIRDLPLRTPSKPLRKRPSVSGT